MFQKMMDKSVAKSPWLFHVNAGSCNGCDIEIVAALTPRYDAERLGFRLAGSPRQADISGTYNFPFSEHLKISNILLPAAA